MTDNQRNILQVHGADIDGALYRFGGKEDIYTACLSAFLEDPSMKAFRAAMGAGAWDDACAAAHTLKGTAGNMGFVPLMKAAEQMVTLLRAGRYQEAAGFAPQLERDHRGISQAVEAFLAAAEGGR